MKKIQLLKRRTFSTVLNETVEFVQGNMGRYSKAFLYFVMPPLLVLMVAITYLFNSFSGIFSSLGATSSEDFGWEHYLRLLSSTLALSFSVFVLLSIVFTVQVLLVYEYILLYERKEDPKEITMEELWGRIRDNALYMVGSYFAFIFIAVLIGGINVAIIMLLVNVSGALAGLVAFASFFFWLYLMIPTTYNYFLIRLRERISVYESLRRCFQLTRGNWWRTFGVQMIAALVAGILQGVCAMPLTIANAIATLHHAAQSPHNPAAIFTPLYGISQAVSIAVGLFFSAITLFAASINYYSLVEQTDNTSLLQEIQHIGEKPDPAYRQEGDY